jgi:hypothetical protein
MMQMRNEKYIENYIKRHGEDPDTSKKGVYHFDDPSGKYKDNWKILGLKLLN